MKIKLLRTALGVLVTLALLGSAAAKPHVPPPDTPDPQPEDLAFSNQTHLVSHHNQGESLGKSDEGNGPGQTDARHTRGVVSEPTKPGQLKPGQAKASGQAKDHGAKASGQAKDHGAKASGQAKDHGAKASGQAKGHGAKASGQAKDHEAKASGQAKASEAKASGQAKASEAKAPGQAKDSQTSQVGAGNNTSNSSAAVASQLTPNETGAIERHKRMDSCTPNRRIFQKTTPKRDPNCVPTPSQPSRGSQGYQNSQHGAWTSSRRYRDTDSVTGSSQTGTDDQAEPGQEPATEEPKSDADNQPKSDPDNQPKSDAGTQTGTNERRKRTARNPPNRRILQWQY
ncbi:clumping factor A-like [Hyalella azteca]|uniref:Clumping factor A-like n=1 Tax=Hyalella azteca TaxID=294128 RepID=A0A8B7NNR5_HYAAZ|nr:clumping factor A-like [Hyalella azteca]